MATSARSMFLVAHKAAGSVSVPPSRGAFGTKGEAAEQERVVRGARAGEREVGSTWELQSAVIASIARCRCDLAPASTSRSKFGRTSRPSERVREARAAAYLLSIPEREHAQHAAAQIMADARVDAKVVLIGDAAVGKTSLVVRFLHDRFDTTLPTVGASYATKQVTLPSGQPFALGIWDTAGQERFDALSSFYCRDARAAVVCFDLTDRASFDSLKDRWLDKVANEAEKNCILCLVGTKSDLVGTNFLRAVSRDEVAAFAKGGAHTFECSARDNTCVDTTAAARPPASTRSFSTSRPASARG